MDLKQLYLELNSIRKVCAVTGLSQSGVWYQLNKFGVLDKKQKITELKNTDDLLIGTYIGLWAGDGSRFYDKGYISKIHIHKENDLLLFFIQKIVKRLFGMQARKYNDGRNRASVKMHSQFIYNFPEEFLEFEKNKTKTIRLKSNFSDKFTRGFFLGLMLSDGYLKKILRFVSISEKLAEQMIYILKSLGFHPKQYIHKRAKYRWNDLYIISLNTKESALAEVVLNSIIKKLSTNKTFSQLKNY